MQTYKLTGDIQVTLAKVTPRRLKEAKELKLFDFDLQLTEAYKEFASSFFDYNEFRRRLNIIFDYKFDDVPDEVLDEFDLEEVSKGFFDFFLRLQTSISESQNFRKILQNLT
ncbi:MAG: hypothetical protein N2043_09695 [Ignavibacterium sp.]|nr:hypothetical protein [Ignavibacterium sp.]